MPKSKDWQEFELLITKIQEDAAPDALVRHNHRIVGDSGRRRQLDITISRNIGLFPVLIVLECKHYKRPVGIDKVEAFVTKLSDVRASEGVMVSKSGFDAGAIAVAQRHGVTLLTYREAEEADWEAITGSETWINLYWTSYEEVTINAVLSDGTQLPIPSNASFRDSDGIEVLTTKQIALGIAETSVYHNPAREFAIEGVPESTFNFKTETGLQVVDKFIVRGRNVITEYRLNMSLASGHIFANPENDEAFYWQVETEPWDFEQILKSKPGRRITPEEWDELASSKNHISLLGTNAKGAKFIRAVITKKIE